MRSQLQKRLKGIFKGDVRVTLWDQYRLLYVRMPKCGNTSIRAAIEGGEDARLSKRQIAAKGDDWTTFSFVRNPWSRLVSAYTHKVRAEAKKDEMIDGVYIGFVENKIPVVPGMSFEEFCEVVCAIPDEITDKHLCSQSYTLIRNDRPIVKFIGKLETMHADWEKLMDMAGLDFELPHSNRSTRAGHEHYSQYYSSDALVQLVADRYADDIRFFGYDFERKTP